MISFFQLLKEVLQRLGLFPLEILLKGDSEKKNTGLLDGILFAIQRTKESSMFMILRSRIELYWVNGYQSYLPRMGIGKPFLE
jgi:hypothetical protein